jgi:hypothetical protein
MNSNLNLNKIEPDRAARRPDSSRERGMVDGEGVNYAGSANFRGRLCPSSNLKDAFSGCQQETKIHPQH